MHTNAHFSLESNRVRQGATEVVVSGSADKNTPSRYPILRTPFAVLDEAYAMALRELELLRTEDGC